MKYLFFDLDGPILDVSEKFYRIYSDIMRRFGYPVLPKSEYWRLKRTRTPIPAIVERTAPAHFVEQYVEERLRVIESVEYLKYDAVHEGVMSLLKQLGQRLPLVLVTLRNKRAALDWELEHLALRPCFQEVLTMEDNHGDYTIKVRLIQDFLKGEQPVGTLIGDTEADIKAAQTLGLRSVGVSFGIRERSYLEALKPDYIVDDVPQLLELLGTETDR